MPCCACLSPPLFVDYALIKISIALCPGWFCWSIHVSCQLPRRLKHSTKAVFLGWACGEKQGHWAGSPHRSSHVSADFGMAIQCSWLYFMCMHSGFYTIDQLFVVSLDSAMLFELLHVFNLQPHHYANLDIIWIHWQSWELSKEDIAIWGLKQLRLKGGSHPKFEDHVSRTCTVILWFSFL